MTTHTPGLSAVQLQRQLGLSYETAWALLHKLRRAMVNPEREPLKDKVEVDETYLGGYDAGVKGRRQLLEKALIVGAVDAWGKGRRPCATPSRARCLGPLADGFRQTHHRPRNHDLDG